MPKRSNRFVTLEYLSGRLVAGYIYLDGQEPRTAVRSKVNGRYVVDYVGDEAVGIEIHSPSLFDLDEFNELLGSLGRPPLSDDEAKPFSND